jgi:DNA-directed RNA polymerase specialized sigma24 family protein
MKQLPGRDRDIVQQRYREGGAVKAIAAAHDATPNAIYKTLARVHRALLQCINGKLEAEGLQ